MPQAVPGWTLSSKKLEIQDHRGITSLQTVPHRYRCSKEKRNNCAVVAEDGHYGWHQDPS
jgi:hypothetical protein